MCISMRNAQYFTTVSSCVHCIDHSQANKFSFEAKIQHVWTGQIYVLITNKQITVRILYLDIEKQNAENDDPKKQFSFISIKLKRSKKISCIHTFNANDGYIMYICNMRWSIEFDARFSVYWNFKRAETDVNDVGRVGRWVKISWLKSIINFSGPVKRFWFHTTIEEELQKNRGRYKNYEIKLEDQRVYRVRSSCGKRSLLDSLFVYLFLVVFRLSF